MPIIAAFSNLQPQIANAFNMQQAATPDTVSLSITTALASSIPMGLMTVGMGMIPLTPTGFNATQTQIKNAFNLQQAANNQLVGQLFSLGISVLSPIVPPVGLSLLQTQIANAFNLQQAANNQLVSTLITNAIISYYTAGMVL